MFITFIILGVLVIVLLLGGLLNDPEDRGNDL